MTMFTLPNFCRVCLKYDKNLIDLEHIENEPSETLMTKLEQCVSEVEWSVFKPLLCHPCIKRLNIAYTFKKQCIQSASMLKSYVTLVKDSKKKEKESQDDKSDGVAQNNAYMMLPNQKYIKIVVGPQSQNTFQNVFLNVVPSTTINTSPPPLTDSKNKDTNQNVFLNINSTFQKFIPGSNDQKTDVSVSKLLTETKTEELSVEIDPTDLGFGDGGSSDNDEDGENGGNDWEELISSTQIHPKTNGTTKHESLTKTNLYGNYVPILPKQSSADDFFNSGQHFLSSQLFSTDFLCETCQRHFSSSKQLKQHVREFHSNKLLYKCDYCYTDHFLKSDYDACIRSHRTDLDPLNMCLTLNDFKSNSSTPEKLIVSTDTTQPTPQELQDLTCELCKRQFNSTSGLLRHKVRKHNQKSKKKYFIKGMKNAKCDICNREFSTQSYMQLHRKLHLRDDIGYKYKVFGKNRYVKNEEPPKNEGKSDSDDDNVNKEQTDNQSGPDRSNIVTEEDLDMDVDEVVVKDEIEEEEHDLKVDEDDVDTGSEEAS